MFHYFNSKTWKCNLLSFPTTAYSGNVIGIIFSLYIGKNIAKKDYPDSRTLNSLSQIMAGRRIDVSKYRMQRKHTVNFAWFFNSFELEQGLNRESMIWCAKNLYEYTVFSTELKQWKSYLSYHRIRVTKLKKGGIRFAKLHCQNEFSSL